MGEITGGYTRDHWHAIWNGRECLRSDIDISNPVALFLEMKRINGWDFADGENSVSWREFQREYEYTKERLGLARGDSLFECCCGCGANLYLFVRDGMDVGGLDYAENMVGMMREIFEQTGHAFREGIVGEAVSLPMRPQYDAVMIAGSLHYFPDVAYAERVLERMLEKAKRSIGVLRVFDEEKRDAFLSYRRAKDANYDERYHDLPKLFLPRSFFETFAARHGLTLRFDSPHLKDFWNDEFVFDCFFYLQGR